MLSLCLASFKVQAHQGVGNGPSKCASQTPKRTFDEHRQMRCISVSTSKSGKDFEAFWSLNSLTSAHWTTCTSSRHRFACFSPLRNCLRTQRIRAQRHACCHLKSPELRPSEVSVLTPARRPFWGRIWTGEAFDLSGNERSQEKRSKDMKGTKKPEKNIRDRSNRSGSRSLASFRP